MGRWWRDDIIDGNRLPLLACFGAFVVTFIVTRVITRMIRADRGPFKNNVSEGGLHVHHAVPGIILLVTGAFVALGSDVHSPWAVVAGLLVGVGTSLVLDEFALILHLQDVYWADEGRISVEMVSLATASLGLVLVGLSPLDVLDDPGVERATATATLTAVGSHLTLILICVAKGKYRMALLGAFLPFLPVIGALRLARPGSRWAKRRYRPEKHARAAARAARWDARFGPVADWLADFVAGKPSQPDPPPPGAAPQASAPAGSASTPGGPSAGDAELAPAVPPRP